jgi:hypothetical protein
MASYWDELFKLGKTVGKKVVGEVPDVVRAARGKVDDVARVVTGKADDVARVSDKQIPLFADDVARAKTEAVGVMSRGERVPVQGRTGARRTRKMAARDADRDYKKANKALNPGFYRSLPVKAKVGLPLAAAGGVLAYTSGIGREDKPKYDISKLELPKAGVVSPEQAAINAKYDADARAVLEKAYGFTPTVPGSEIYDPMSGVTNQLGGASVLSMQDIANQYAQGAAATQARGAQAGQSINDIYGQGASTLEAIGAQPSSEYDSMIPVYGDAAVAPAQQRMEGQNISDYLTRNQLIDAQAQGGMAELANMLGPAYANQYAMMDRQARMQADADKVRMEAQYRNENSKNLADALAQMELTKLDRNYENSRIALALGAYNLPDPDVVNRLVQEWEIMPKQDKEYYRIKANVTDVESYINFRIQQDQALQQQQGV